jgi:hypothetical protein
MNEMKTIEEMNVGWLQVYFFRYIKKLQMITHIGNSVVGFFYHLIFMNTVSRINEKVKY